MDGLSLALVIVTVPVVIMSGHIPGRRVHWLVTGGGVYDAGALVPRMRAHGQSGHCTNDVSNPHHPSGLLSILHPSFSNLSPFITSQSCIHTTCPPGWYNPTFMSWLNDAGLVKILIDENVMLHPLRAQSFLLYLLWRVKRHISFHFPLANDVLRKLD